MGLKPEGGTGIVLFATLATNEQLPHAIRLAKSVKQHHPEARMVLCLIDYHLPAEHTAVFDEVLHISRQEHPKGNQAGGGRGPAKAYFIKYLLNRCLDDIIYLDAETIVVSRFEEVFALLREHPIVAVPFNLEPYPKEHDHREIERLRRGFIDSGCLALKNSIHARQFADWWSKRVDRTAYCADESEGTDHLWLSLALMPFRIRLMKEPGYRFGPWNWHEKKRSLNRQTADGIYFNNGKRLRSFVAPAAYETYQASAVPVDPRTRSVAEALLANMEQQLEQIRQTLP